MTHERKGLLTWAIEEERWDVAALALALGFVNALAELPPEALDELMAELDDKPRPGAHQRKRETPRGRHR